MGEVFVWDSGENGLYGVVGYLLCVSVSQYASVFCAVHVAVAICLLPVRIHLPVCKADSENV